MHVGETGGDVGQRERFIKQNAAKNNNIAIKTHP